MRVVFSDRAYVAVLAETYSKISTETGGVFLGKYADETWYIVEAIDPGPKSIFRVDYFEYDQAYVQHLINKKALLYHTKLDLIGLWHRHPGSFDIFSTTDGETNSQYAVMRDEGAISMLVNLEPEFRFTIYHVAQPCTYSRIFSFEVGDELFPKDLLKYRNPEILRKCLNREIASYNAGYFTEQNIEVEQIEKKTLLELMKSVRPELEKNYAYEHRFDLRELVSKLKDNSKQIAECIAQDLLFLSDKYSMRFFPINLSDKIVVSQESDKDRCVLTFTYSGKDEGVLLTFDDRTYYYEEGLLKRLIQGGESDGVYDQRY